jgi:amino acid permease
MGQGYAAIEQGHFSFNVMLSTYAGIFVFFLLWIGHKLYSRSSSIDNLVVTGNTGR